MLPTINTPDRQAEAFPVLTPAQIARIRPYGNVRSVQAGEVLFEPGKLGMSCFVVLTGKLDIVMSGLSGEQVYVTYGPGQFSGEVVLISGARALSRGRVAEPGEFLEISADALRTLIAKDAELSDIFMRAFLLRRVALISEGLGNVIVLGSQHSSQTLRLREFLTRNGHPHSYVDLDSDKASQELLDRFEIKLEDIPVVICSGTTVLRNPTNQRLAECLGFAGHIDEHHVYDVAIVGAGPAGLAAAVYAASEGLNAVVIESQFPGGQAGASSKIENYVGFPMGISGQELTGRAVMQAEKFGAQMMVGQKVAKIRCDQRPYQLTLENGGIIDTRSIVIAAGAQYNKPNVENLEKFEGQGIYYAATVMEAQLCTGEEIIVVGGGNSAGQAAVFLGESVRKVYMLVRGKELSDTMSRYLVQRVVENPGIELHFQTEIVALAGDSHLERVTWLNRATGETSAHDIRHVFVMAGASPRTDWLGGCLALDQQGFILTGRDLDRVLESAPLKWPLSRPPQMLETSLPAVYAVGDIRSGNVKRVASAVGEGSISIHLVHRALAAM
ncbi:MAG TPA: FAD-dependent oxidoreductase [Terracidiphilus sp.]|jgi:thioredoxin reductase (NADPH)|nr:FAD-dependent oxidoreductase [Terracidiphilus sp.]